MTAHMFTGTTNIDLMIELGRLGLRDTLLFPPLKITRVGLNRWEIGEANGDALATEFTIGQTARTIWSVRRILGLPTP